MTGSDVDVSQAVADDLNSPITGIGCRIFGAWTWYFASGAGWVGKACYSPLVFHLIDWLHWNRWAKRYTARKILQRQPYLAEVDDSDHIIYAEIAKKDVYFKTS
jgi:hypothetical protein